MDDQYARTRMLLGGEGMARLRASRVAVFGLGGVGSYAFEALVRSGVGAVDVIDNDIISVSNLNRQLLALRSTVGMKKTDAAAARAADIDPETVIRCYPVFVTAENAGDFPFAEYDYIVDAIDTVSAKIELILRAKDAGVPILSSMGTGNKLDPSRLRIADLSETRYCPGRGARQGHLLRGDPRHPRGGERDQGRPGPPGAGQHGLCPAGRGTHDRRRGRAASCRDIKNAVPNGTAFFVCGGLTRSRGPCNPAPRRRFSERRPQRQPKASQRRCRQRD